MMTLLALFGVGAVVSGCGLASQQRDQTGASVTTSMAATTDGAPDITNSARFVPADLPQSPREAVLRPQTNEQRLGAAIASLGDPTLSGFWVRTPLVTRPVRGRVVNRTSGASVQVDLLPVSTGAQAQSHAGQGAMTQASLATMRLLTSGLSDQPEVVLFSG